MSRRREMKKKIEVKQDEENPVPAEILAQAILDMGKAMKLLTKSRLKRDALVVLIKDKTGITKIDINRVLDSLESLEKDWLK
jgi:hypothetical protein